MKTDLKGQKEKEYKNYLRTSLMVKEWTPKLKKIAEDLKHMKDWTLTFGSEQRILVMFYSVNEKKSSLSNFVEICDYWEKNFEIALDKSFHDWLGEKYEYLQAEGKLPEIVSARCAVAPVLQIRMFNLDNCELEYTEETIRKPKLTGFCAELIKGKQD